MDHFYVKEFTENEFLQIEKAALSSIEWGEEVDRQFIYIVDIEFYVFSDVSYGF